MVFFSELIDIFKQDKYLKFLFEPFYNPTASKLSDYEKELNKKRAKYSNYFGNWWYIYYYIVESGIFGVEKEAQKSNLEQSLKYFVIKNNHI